MRGGIFPPPVILHTPRCSSFARSTTVKCQPPRCKEYSRDESIARKPLAVRHMRLRIPPSRPGVSAAGVILFDLATDMVGFTPVPFGNYCLSFIDEFIRMVD